jgi:hypothetical protein
MASGDEPVFCWVPVHKRDLTLNCTGFLDPV